MSKTFTLLSDLPMIKIDRCAQILPNKLQCPRTGVYLVQDSGPSQTPSSSSGGTGKSDPQTKDPNQTFKQKQTSFSSKPADKSAEGEKPAKPEDPSKGGPTDQPAKDPKTDPAGSPATPSPAESGGVTSSPEPYQLCIAHKIIAERAQEQAVKSGGNADELQAKILGDEENYRLNHPPISPDDFKSIHERDKELKKEEEHDTQQQPAGTAV